MIWVALIAIVGVVVLAIVGWIGVGRARASLAALRDENAALRAQLQTTNDALNQNQAATNKALRKLDRHHERIERQNNRLKNVRADLSASNTPDERLVQRQDGLVKLVTEIRSEVSKTRKQLANHRERTEELRSRVGNIRVEQTERQESQGRLNKELRSGLAEVKSTSRNGRLMADRLGGQPIHGSKRSLDDDALETLLEIAPVLGLDWLNERPLRYMEHAVGALEARLRGRLAAPVEAMILRAMVAMAAPSDDVKVLEIGTLYGLSACYFHEVVRPQRSSLHQTIVDPFMGYYDEGAPDLFTPIPITEAVAAENLQRVGATVDDYELIVGLSEDAKVRAQLADHRFDVVVIDGDHSYDGVRRDFENYAGHVVPGGFVIIDDYQGPSWPDVTRYVDETVFPDERFEVVTGQLRTAVVRRL